jgi:hypothetical protein
MELFTLTSKALAGVVPNSTSSTSSALFLLLSPFFPTPELINTHLSVNLEVSFTVGSFAPFA